MRRSGKPVFSPLLDENDHFTKTGSGQAEGKLCETTVFSQVSVPLEAALASGKLDVAKLMAGAKPANCVPTVPRIRNATFHLSKQILPPVQKTPF